MNFYLTNAEFLQKASTTAQQNNGVVLLSGTTTFSGCDVCTVTVTESYVGGGSVTYADTGVEQALLASNSVVVDDSNFFQLPPGTFAVTSSSSCVGEKAMLLYVASKFEEQGHYARVMLQDTSFFTN